MAERYIKLWAGPVNLYQEGSPVIIAATALLHDTQRNVVLAQIKFKCISSKSIKAVKIKIIEHDTVGRILCENTEFQYLDLAAFRNTDFGQKTPVPLKNAETRSFEVFVTEVAFDDNTIWKSTSTVWAQLPLQRSLSTIFCDPELLNQYCMKYGQDSEFEPIAANGLWFCKCGAVNYDDEEHCSKCRSSRKAIFEADIDRLKTERDERLKAAAAIKEKQRAEEEKTKQKKIRYAVIAGVALLVVIISVFVVINVIIPANKYSKAEALSSKGDYDGAIAIFQELGDYKDCDKQISYQEALKKMSEEDYYSAINAFETLGDFKESSAKKHECMYQLAIKDVEYRSHYAFEESRNLFEELGDYKDSKDYLSRFYSMPSYVIDGNGITSTLNYDETGTIREIRFEYRKEQNYHTYDYLCIRKDIQYDQKGRVISYSTKTNIVFSSTVEIGTVTFKYSSDGSCVKKEKKKDQYNVSYDITTKFDKYGNSYFESTTKLYPYGSKSKYTYNYKHKLDKFGNATMTEAKNDSTHHTSHKTNSLSYSEEGNLLSVSTKYGLSYEVKYGYVYIPDGEANVDIVIENLKRMDVIRWY